MLSAFIFRCRVTSYGARVGVAFYTVRVDNGDMARKTTRCEECGYRVKWDPETREGPTVFFEKGLCPSCGTSFGDRAPVSARRGRKRR